MPTFSVVICTYNRAAVVARAIRSVLAQTFPDFELVVVDDGSKDETREVVASFEDPRVTYVYQSNRGLSAARNTGVANASGRFVVFLDDDDEATTQWLERFHDHIGGEDVVATCGAIITDENGRPMETVLPRPLGPVFEDATGLFRSGTFVVPREAYWAAGGFAEDLHCSHQTEFALRLLPLCRQQGWRVLAIDEPLARHVARPPDQRLRTPATVLQGTRFIIARHETQLRRAPDVLAAFLATAGVAAARVGDYREARRLLRRAMRLRPWQLRHVGRLILACVPPLGDVVWNVRRYRNKAVEPVRPSGRA